MILTTIDLVNAYYLLCAPACEYYTVITLSIYWSDWLGFIGHSSTH